MVKELILTMALVVVGGTVLADDRTVIVPKDDKPFTVVKTDLIRLTGRGIAGSKMEVEGRWPGEG